MQAAIDRYTTQALCDTLGRKRPTLADWCKALQIEPRKEG